MFFKGNVTTCWYWIFEITRLFLTPLDTKIKTIVSVLPIVLFWELSMSTKTPAPNSVILAALSVFAIGVAHNQSCHHNRLTGSMSKNHWTTWTNIGMPLIYVEFYNSFSIRSDNLLVRYEMADYWDQKIVKILERLLIHVTLANIVEG